MTPQLPSLVITAKFAAFRSFLIPLIWALIFTILASFQGCSPKQEATVTVLRIGILPDRGEEMLRTQYTPLFDYLTKTIGLPYELIIPKNYDELVADFVKGNINLAYFGGVTFVQAQREANAIPIVMRDVDTRFTSYFIVHADNPAKDFVDLKGKRITFGSNSSTSGHYMPRHFLLRDGITPESFFSSVEYSGAHDMTVYRVRDKQVELGAVNAQIYSEMLSTGRIKASEVRVIWETPPYTDYVWAIQSNLDKSLRLKIRDAFLDLALDNPQHREILNKIGATVFLPADISDFSELGKILKNISVD